MDNKKTPCPPNDEKRLYMDYNEDYDADEIDIVDILMIFWSKKYLILASIFIFILAGLAYTTIMVNPYYESRTTLLFMPPVPTEMSAEMRGERKTDSDQRALSFHRTFI